MHHKWSNIPCPTLFGLMGPVVLAASPFLRAQQQAKARVQVFILPGQSNMQGKGPVEHLEQLVAEDPIQYGHPKDNGQWRELDDVWVKHWDRRGRLTVGYGTPENRIGPELGFGHTMSEALEARS